MEQIAWFIVSQKKNYKIPTYFGMMFFMKTNNVFVGRNVKRNLHKLENFLDDDIVDTNDFNPDHGIDSIRNILKAIDVRECVRNNPFNFPHVGGRSTVKSIGSRILCKHVDEHHVAENWRIADLNESQVQSLTIIFLSFVQDREQLHWAIDG
jgi:hypothetical protein